MYLIDTNVLSELRKKRNANEGVKRFFKSSQKEKIPLYLSVITLGELRRGVELVRYRQDHRQANTLENWLDMIVSDYGGHILDFDADVAQLWGVLRSPHHENAIDKQIAATALIYGLTLVTRNLKDFEGTGALTLNPFD